MLDFNWNIGISCKYKLTLTEFKDLHIKSTEKLAKETAVSLLIK